jgi:hypothetical protein
VDPNRLISTPIPIVAFIKQSSKRSFFQKFQMEAAPGKSYINASTLELIFDLCVSS